MNNDASSCSKKSPDYTGRTPHTHMFAGYLVNAKPKTYHERDFRWRQQAGAVDGGWVIIAILSDTVLKQYASALLILKQTR